MRLLYTDTEKRVSKSTINKGGYIEYDSDNIYPNKIKFLAKTSPMAQNCLKTYTRFIVGKGFADPNLNNFIINKYKRTRVIDLLRKNVYDFCLNRGVSTHINYNGLGVKTTLDYMPFENCRLGKPDDTGYINWIVTNKDWVNGKDSDNIKFFTYDLNAVTEQIAEVLKKDKDIKKYRGQIYWFSCDGFGNYPEATIDCVATDCSTEEGLANIRYRNARYNFLPAGMLVKPGKTEAAKDEVSENLSEQELLEARYRGFANRKKDEDDFGKKFIQAQGDKNACKIILCEIAFGEEEPKFIEFPSKNYDKEFTVTEASCRHNIGSIFNQPPVLRGELIAGKLGTAQEMNDAYNVYNNWTIDDRAQISEIFKELLTNFEGANFNNFEITPLSYASDGNISNQ